MKPNSANDLIHW